MRGASALDDALAATTDVPVHAEVVWLPVLLSDRVPWRPTNRPLVDPRIVQTWDPDWAVSQHLMAFARSHQEWLSDEERALVADPDTILWDAVMIWPPGVRWADLSAPSFHGAPVVEVSDQLADEIRSAAWPRTESTKVP